MKTTNSRAHLAWLLPALLLSLLLPPALARAETRAWVDRDSIELGETVTLNIETDTGARPDYAPLQDDFHIEQRSSRQSFEQSAGRSVSRTLYAVALQPERTGRVTVPALRVGSARTAPITLTVTAASAAPARARGLAFIDAELDDTTPYVQQAVGLRLRLYYAAQLLSGQFDQPAPDGAALQRAGSDVQYTREIDGRRYRVVERRYVLVPERSGRLELPPANFRGRGVGGWLDDLFGDGQRGLSADGPPLVLQVKPVPDAAPRPWLPLHGLELRWRDAPDRVRAGDAATLELELVADGATGAQLEPPMITVDQGAQVFPEPVQHDDMIEDGRPRVRMLRRFAVLPAREGRLRIEGPRLQWWDVNADRMREATLPALELDVAPAASGTAAAVPPGDGGLVRLPGVQHGVGAWALATVAFALLWLATLAWALQWRHRAQAGDTAPRDDDAAARSPGARRPWQGSALRRVLDTGDLGDVSAALCALASPAAADLDALSRMLAPGPQREAIAALQRARWGQDEGGASQARAAVRAAFARGPDWLPRDSDIDPPLPPLYPR
ncbi:BatD family protein [Luteimonas terricola]|uniref:Membrane protein n=1 Tax=Luteimonas terricola TaxID=645597 RepID=A0ABQ2E748_9GAMM|nr:BatD family protein [Luteimonas terricola]GGJ98976.1 membrane protein [Luteimonas terricola]